MYHFKKEGSFVTIPTGWKHQDKVLHKEFHFKSYLEGAEFVNQVAHLADQANHHPDIELGYKRVTITLTTHDEGQVTTKDTELAEEINALGNF